MGYSMTPKMSGQTLRHSRYSEIASARTCPAVITRTEI